ncbi:hypothetical protein FISHEDRAFT_35252 [Fistulina hepatica ATCC 64428]|uniref:Uncharacterized protein n=1 Tax=Fistulina hepatica ATCC 64428 TaxID=1128425 RepID=A0A0D7AM76_9AGAR|nr:hypothetical protein FISHEDRAFT_35252 [Fistulina hepatica ATCC 64428]
MTSTPSFSSVNGKGKAKAVAEDGNPRAQIARYPASERTTRTMSTGSGKGKRKASEVESSGHTPPEKKGRTTFAADNRPHRSSATSTSASSRAPSSYYHREPKRVRLSPMATPDNAQRATRSSKLPSSLPGDPFGRTAAVGSRRSPIPSPTAYRPPLRSTSIQQQAGGVRRPPSVSRNSLSQVSIPISALITPHAPDASVLSRGTYHMRDPTRPPAIKPTPWSLRFVSDAGDPGSPVQAWLFFVGFIIFPVWWIAGFLRIPKTRTLHVSPDPSQPARPGGPVVLDNPQVEHDARSWRLRCRVMSGVSLLTYVPFIVCVAVFVPR